MRYATAAMPFSGLPVDDSGKPSLRHVGEVLIVEQFDGEVLGVLHPGDDVRDEVLLEREHEVLETVRGRLLLDVLVGRHLGGEGLELDGILEAELGSEPLVEPLNELGEENHLLLGGAEPLERLPR